MKTLFLDESGNHDLARVSMDYPVFVLAGVICNADYAAGEMEERVQGFKYDLFGRTDIILHTADIVRSKNGFEALGEIGFRTRFFCALNALMQSLRYRVVACAIKKADHVARYGKRADDPYHFSLQPVVERFCYDIGDVFNGGQIIAECRGPQLDAALLGAYDDLCHNGTLFMPGSKILYRVMDLRCELKSKNIAGLQIADLVATPIGRYVLGKPIKEDFEVIRKKFRMGPDGFEGRGLIVLPKK